MRVTRATLAKDTGTRHVTLELYRIYIYMNFKGQCFKSCGFVCTIGEPQLNDLCCIILRFRCHPVGICTDIEKAFLHVWLHEDDRDWTRFLWLTDPLDPESEFNTYRFRVVLFGAMCSPYNYVECHPTLSSVSVQVQYSTGHAHQPICG